MGKLGSDEILPDEEAEDGHFETVKIQSEACSTIPIRGRF